MVEIIVRHKLEFAKGESSKLDKILQEVLGIKNRIGSLATEVQYREVLGAINTRTTAAVAEIKADFAALLAKPDVPDSVVAELQEKFGPLMTELEAIASAFPPVEVPPDAPAPGSEPLPTE